MIENILSRFCIHKTVYGENIHGEPYGGLYQLDRGVFLAVGDVGNGDDGVTFEQAWDVCKKLDEKDSLHWGLVYNRQINRGGGRGIREVRSYIRGVFPGDRETVKNHVLWSGVANTTGNPYRPPFSGYTISLNGPSNYTPEEYLTRKFGVICIGTEYDQ